MTGQGTGTQLPFTCPGPLCPAFHAPPKSLRISHIIAQAALKALPPRAPNSPPHGAVRTLAQDLWPSRTSLEPSPRPTRHRPGTLRGTGTGSPADPGKTQAKASTPPKRPSRQGPPAGLLSPHQNLGRQSRRGQGPRCSPATYRQPLRPTPRAGPHGGSRRPESPAELTHTAGSPPHTGPATPKAFPPGTGAPGPPEACLPPPAPQGCTHPREPRQRDPPPTSPVGATCRTSVCDEETVVSSHSFCSDFPRNAFVGVIIDPSTGTPAGRPPPQPPPPGRPASSLLAAARRLPSPTAGKQVSSTPGSRGCGSGRHTPPPGGYLGAGHCRLPSPTRWPSIPPPAARQHASLRQEGLAFPGSLPTGSGFRSPRWPPSLRRSSWVRATTDTRKHASARGQAAQGTGAGPPTAQGLWAAWLPPVPGLPPLTGCQQPKRHTEWPALPLRWGATPFPQEPHLPQAP